MNILKSLWSWDAAEMFVMASLVVAVRFAPDGWHLIPLIVVCGRLGSVYADRYFNRKTWGAP
jgi:hypothetical protein